MANQIPPYAATIFAMEIINAKINSHEHKHSTLQSAANQLFSGITGGIAITPFFYGHQIIKDSAKQFPAVKTWYSVKNFMLLNKGQNWNRYANLQGLFGLRGAGLGLAAAGFKHFYQNWSSRPD